MLPMAHDSPARETPSRRGLWLRRSGYVVGALAALILVAWVAVPPLVRGQVESRLSALLDRPTTVEAVAFDPFRLRLTLRKLVVGRGEGKDSLFSFDELVADVSPASLWHRAPVLDALRIVRPNFWLLRDGEGRYDIQDLIDALMAKPIEVPRASLNNIEIVDGTAVFVDRATGRNHELKALDIAIPFLSSLPYEASIHVEPRVKGSFNGSPFALTGTSTPFAEQREATLDIGIEALPLPSYVAYLPFKPRVDLAGGTLTTQLQVVFVAGSNQKHRLELRGDARIDGLAIKRRDGTPLASAQRIAIGIDKIDLLEQDAQIATVTIDAPAMDVKRLADGTLRVGASAARRRAGRGTAACRRWCPHVGAARRKDHGERRHARARRRDVDVQVHADRHRRRGDEHRQPKGRAGAGQGRLPVVGPDRVVHG